MTETVTAPEATEAEGTEAASATPAKAPVSTKEKITKALGKDMPALHVAFIEWVKREADVDLDPTSVLATQSLYNVYRQTDEFKTKKAELPSAAPKETPMPTTPEEAQAALAKHEADTKRRQAAAQRADERAEKIKALLAEMSGGEAGETSDEATPVAESDEELQESF